MCKSCLNTWNGIEGKTYYVTPPPALPIPAINPFAVPTTFLSKKHVLQTWHGTKLAPRIPTKNRRTIRPFASVTRPAMAVGTAPARRIDTKVIRGPKRSQSGPAMARTRSVATNATTLEFATSSWVRLMSLRMVFDNWFRLYERWET